MIDEDAWDQTVDDRPGDEERPGRHGHHDRARRRRVHQRVRREGAGRARRTRASTCPARTSSPSRSHSRPAATEPAARGRRRRRPRAVPHHRRRGTMTTDDDAIALRLDRDHVFHSWSAQAHLSPLVIAGGLGSTVWDHAGRRYLDFSSQLVNTNIGHQHPRVVAAIQEQAATLTTVAPGDGQPDARPRRRAGAQPRARRVQQRLLHQRRGRRQRERDPDGPPAHRPRQGGVARTARTTATPARPWWRRGTGGGCPTSTPARTCTTSVRTCTARSSGRPRPSRSPSARCTTWSA